MDERTPGIRPRPSLGRLLDVDGTHAAFPAPPPRCCCCWRAGPLGLPGQAELQWALVLGCVFFWSLFRPASLPPLLVFALGVLADLLGYGPLGVGRADPADGARAGDALAAGAGPAGLHAVWLAFAAVAGAATALQWGLLSVLAVRLLPPGPAAFEVAWRWASIRCWPWCSAAPTAPSRSRRSHERKRLPDQGQQALGGVHPACAAAGRRPGGRARRARRQALPGAGGRGRALCHPGRHQPHQHAADRAAARAGCSTGSACRSRATARTGAPC